MSLADALATAVRGEPVPDEAMRGAIADMLSGEADEVRVAGLLTALAVRGETPAEIAAGARTMRAAARMIEAPPGTIDTCGTGGTGLHTLNVSTATALVLASLGVPVAKHGNKAASSLSGSADVLGALDVRAGLDPEQSQAVLAEVGIAFLFAPTHHPAVRHVANVRKRLGFRTLFNLLGPLSNPAGAKRQLMGVADGALCRPMAEALGALGSERAWVVHGEDGLDELTVCGPSRACILAAGKVTERTVTPEEAGLPRHPPGALRGGDPDHNAAALRRLLDGERGAYRDAVALNAAAGLIVAGRTSGLAEGARLAEGAIDDGRARATLSRLVNATEAA